jgi:hypothetical protein
MFCRIAGTKERIHVTFAVFLSWFFLVTHSACKARRLLRGAMSIS